MREPTMARHHTSSVKYAKVERRHSKRPSPMRNFTRYHHRAARQHARLLCVYLAIEDEAVDMTEREPFAPTSDRRLAYTTA